MAGMAGYESSPKATPDAAGFVVFEVDSSLLRVPSGGSFFIRCPSIGDPYPGDPIS